MKSCFKALFGSGVIAVSALVLSATVPVEAQVVRGGNMCLNLTYVRNSQAVDARTIVYRMKNGEVWRNTLAAPCPDLVSTGVGGYSQKSHDDWICANTQQITVQTTGMVCRLGEFTRVN
jgi:hypothetical protein